MYDHIIQHWTGGEEVTHAILKDGELFFCVCTMKQGSQRERDVDAFLQQAVERRNEVEHD